MPVVVYAPTGFEIRYRIWAAAEDYLMAGEG
jgi:serine protease inhibitor ecotin